MSTELKRLKSKLTSLHNKEYKIVNENKKKVTAPTSRGKIQSRILNEFKLKELRREIEQLEYKFYETRILCSLQLR